MHRFLFFLPIIFVLNTPVWSSNLSFLNNSAISYFNETDKDLMVRNAMRALNNKPDNTKSSWHNAGTGAWGYAVPSQTSQKRGIKCRKLLLFNSAKDVTGRSAYKICKIGGIWKLISFQKLKTSNVFISHNKKN